ncbi:MAG: DUF6036 family nucleotidyltransferase [Anaeroplasmataceae bacterium]
MTSINSFSKPSNTVLNKEYIDRIINDLNTVLMKKNKSLTITIYGGSCLCLLNKFRDSTYDIDTLSDDNLLLEECISELKLTKDLINTEIEVFINRNESLELYKDLGSLKVYLPTLDYLLAMKIRASRAKDRNDIKLLLKELSVLDLKSVKELFTRYYSPVQFNVQKTKYIINILKEIV